MTVAAWLRQLLTRPPSRDAQIAARRRCDGPWLPETEILDCVVCPCGTTQLAPGKSRWVGGDGTVHCFERPCYPMTMTMTFNVGPTAGGSGDPCRCTGPNPPTELP